MLFSFVPLSHNHLTHHQLSFQEQLMLLQVHIDLVSIQPQLRHNRRSYLLVLGCFPSRNQDKYKYVYTVDTINNKVQKGESFRNAYKTLIDEIESDKYKKPKSVNYSHIGSIGNLSLELIKENNNEIIDQLNSTGKLEDDMQKKISEVILKMKKEIK